MERVAHIDQRRGDDPHVKAVKNASQAGDERDPADKGLVHVRLHGNGLIHWDVHLTNDTFYEGFLCNESFLTKSVFK